MIETSDQIIVNGAELGYSTFGSSQYTQPSLVFLHGYAMRSTGGLYKELLEFLAERYAVYALDLRGHGASAGSIAHWTYDSLADDLVAFCEALKLNRPTVVGHSFGAVIGLLAAVRDPKTFSALCLLSPGPADERDNPVETLNYLVENGRDREKLRDPFGNMFSHSSGAKLELTLDAATLVAREIHLAHKEQALRFSIDDDLRGVALPALVVTGRCDNVVPLEKHLDMAHKLPYSKQVVYSGQGHMLPIESGPIAGREIYSFLASPEDTGYAG